MTYYEMKLKSSNIESHAVQIFERMMREYFNVEYAILTSSATSAFEIVFSAINLPDKSISIPSFTFASPAIVASRHFKNLIFVDNEPNKLCSGSQNFFKSKQKPDVILPTHIGGLSCNMRSLVKLAKQQGALIIEDVAQAFGCEFNGQKLGTFGDVGVFSFGKSKFPTCGEGGLIITNNKGLANDCRTLLNYGLDESNNLYYHSTLGYNAKLSDIQANFLISQWEEFEEKMNRRDKNGRLILDMLNSSPVLRAIETSWNNLSSFYMPSFLFSGRFRDEIIENLIASGMPVSHPSKFPFPVFENPCFNQTLNITITEIPNANFLYKSIFVLGHPGHSSLLDLEFSQLKKRLLSYLEFIEIKCEETINES
jgi:perosamine synthetase